MNTLDILNELAATSSRNDKIAILKKHESNALFKRVVWLALHPRIQFYIRKIPDYNTEEFGPIQLEWALDQLMRFNTRELTGNSAVSHLAYTLSHLTAANAEVISRILAKDLKCGVDDSSVNKAWPKFIPEYPVCLAHKDISGIRYPAYAQPKKDGGRCILHYDDDCITAFTRNGSVIHTLGILEDDVKNLMLSGEKFDGEIVFFEDNVPLDRKTSNGLFNKCIKNTISTEEIKKIRFIVWDIIDESETVPYHKRVETLSDRFTTVNAKHFFIIDNVLVNNETEALEFYKKCIDNGEEGSILKNIDFMWKPKRTKDVGKMKVEEDIDLEVIEWTEGTGKYKNKLGALLCRTADSKLCVSVGIGFSDQERDEFSREFILGKIISVKYNQIITNKDNDKMSLFLPRYIEVRYDLSEANCV